MSFTPTKKLEQKIKTLEDKIKEYEAIKAFEKNIQNNKEANQQK